MKGRIKGWLIGVISSPTLLKPIIGCVQCLGRGTVYRQSSHLSSMDRAQVGKDCRPETNVLATELRRQRLVGAVVDLPSRPG